jgi:hypothetical protein
MERRRPAGKRRWRARAPKPVGASVAHGEREASWSAERSSAIAVKHAPSPNFKVFVSPRPTRIRHRAHLTFVEIIISRNTRKKPATNKRNEAERDLKFFLKFFLDRRVRAGKMLLSTSPTLDVDSSGLI